MRKNDYELVAQALYETNRAVKAAVDTPASLAVVDGTINAITNRLCAAFRANNPRFQEERFRQAVRDGVA